MDNTEIKYDTELQHLIDLSGMREDHIAEKLNITPEYLSLIKYRKRKAFDKRMEIKNKLISFIKHNLDFKFAA